MKVAYFLSAIIEIEICIIISAIYSGNNPVLISSRNFVISGAMSSNFEQKDSIEKLKGSENFATWAFAVRSLLEVQDLEKCIVLSSSTRVATETDAGKLKKAKAKLVLSICPNLYVHIQQCTTALEIWTKLKTMFEDKGLSRRIGLLRTLITTNLENSDGIDDYISRIIGATNKLSGIGFNISSSRID